MKTLDDGLKQRLIGAIILLALGVIFLPVFFDREPIEPVDRTTQIPPAPEIVTVEINPPEELKNVDLAPPPDQMYVPNVEQDVPMTEAPIGLDQEGVPKSWVLQVASFQQAELAEALRARLVESDFPAYTRKVTVGGVESVRVLVGPKLDKSALMKNKQEIDNLFKVNAILLEFKPK